MPTPSSPHWLNTAPTPQSEATIRAYQSLEYLTLTLAQNTGFPLVLGSDFLVRSVRGAATRAY